ncbi:hypothetical protein [Rhodanobacter sp. Soil772]|uniref:hypothetical protein n=1 Tax=Rhodanobacter sp. Soil772 TaxID=1736406 RepID=UPI0012FCDEF9|nr:hypothetical protein [Rhodanobacter sp. Soil772]
MMLDESVEGQFEAALQRLLAGTPRSPRLATLAQKRKIRVSFAVIAEEAGHSRTLIGFDGCQYQKFREKVKAILAKGPRAADLAHALEAAHERIQALEAKLCLKNSIQASLLLELNARERAPPRTLGKVTHISR